MEQPAKTRPRPTTPAAEPMKAERVQSRVRRIRGWKASEDSRALRRSYEFPSPEAGVRFAAFIVELARDLEHWPELVLHRNTLTVTSTTPEAQGVTELDFDLIHCIDDR